MTITVGEAIQRVQSLYSRGLQSKDSRLTPRHIYSALKTARSTVLEQKYNKNQYLSSWNYQTIPCVEMVDAPLHECPCAPNGQLFLRSKYKLPLPITGIDKLLISQTSTLDNTIRFDYKEFDTFRYAKGKKWTSNKPIYFYRNQYLYLGLVKRIKAVPVTGLFHDPVEVRQYPVSCDECQDCNCDSPFDMDFHVDGELLKTILEIANQECIIMLKQMSSDEYNDAGDDADVRSAMIHQNDQQQ